MKRTRLNPISKRRENERAARWAVVADVVLRDRGACTAALLVPAALACGGPLDPHEVIPRSAWAKGYLVVDNVRLVCRQHHDWIGDHPLEAHELGLHGFSWERPA